MRHEKINTLRLRTPEGVSFSFELASPVARFLAWGIDFVVMLALIFLLMKGATLFRLVSLDFYQALLFLVYFSVSIGYGIVFEWMWRGQTIGKKLLRLRVMDETGLPLQFRQVVLRNLLRVVDKLPYFYLVGGISAVLSAKSQRLGDMASGTVVVRIRTLAPPALEELL